MTKVSFDEKSCKGCMLCISVCPKKIIEVNTDFMNKKGYNPVRIIDAGQCISCGMCAIICPDSVIKVERDVK